MVRANVAIGSMAIYQQFILILSANTEDLLQACRTIDHIIAAMAGTDFSPTHLFHRVVNIARHSNATEREAKVEEAISLLTSSTTSPASLVLASLLESKASMKMRNSFDRLAFACLYRLKQRHVLPTHEDSQRATKLLFRDDFLTNFACEFCRAFGIMPDRAQMVNLCARYIDESHTRAAGNVLAGFQLYDSFQPAEVYRKILHRSADKVMWEAWKCDWIWTKFG